MAKLNRLIKGQDLAFDTHQAGDGQPVNWKDLHMEKRLHGNRGKLKFPLFGGQKPSKPKNMSNVDYNNTISEVRKELKKNPSRVKELADTISSQVKKFVSKEVTLEHAVEAADKIAEAFDLDKTFNKSVVSKFGNIMKLSSYHIDRKDGLMYMISQTEKKTVVETARFKNYK